jgi:RNA polymerase sigma-70 factor (ECF subfamily)
MSRPDFDNLIQQLSRKLYGFAFRILRNQEEAEDVVQEVFIKLWKMEQKLDEYKSVEALATTMTKNCCIDIIRKQKHIYSEDIGASDYQGIASPSPHYAMENRETGEILHRIISDLPEVYKAVIKMRDIDGDSYDEIAKKTGQNINTLRVTLSRARKIIRDEYNKYQYERRGIETTYRKVL